MGFINPLITGGHHPAWQNIKHSWRLECSPHALQGPGASLWQGLSAEVVGVGFWLILAVNTRMNSLLRLTLYISQSISLPHTDLAGLEGESFQLDMFEHPDMTNPEYPMESSEATWTCSDHLPPQGGTSREWPKRLRPFFALPCVGISIRCELATLSSEATSESKLSVLPSW